MAATLLVGVAGTGLVLTLRDRNATTAALSEQGRSIAALKSEVHSLESKVASQPDWTAIARDAKPSVFTIVTAHGLGSGWVARTGARGSDLVTNFHVIGDAWNLGNSTVEVRQGDQTMNGTITQVDRTNDLAVVHLAGRFAALPTAAERPQLGETVMAVGSPLGLGGSISLGVVSRFGSLEGADYVQFTAAISPGNSGGPVLDRRGRVVAVAAGKFVGQGVEGLSLAIPVQVVCIAIIACNAS